MLVVRIMSNTIPEKPQKYIIVDIIMNLPWTKSYKSILVVCDRLLKISHFITTTGKKSAEGPVRLFRDNM